MPSAGIFRRSTPVSPLIKITLFVLLLVGLYLTSLVNYLLFHSLIELYSIVVAFCVFIIAWHSRHYIQNPYLLFIGLAYFFIAFLDLFHTLSYKGMPVFTDYAFYANQLWIGARLMESTTLLLGFFYLRRRKHVDPFKIVAAYSVVTILLMLSIFQWKVFPECFVEGYGLTPFKKIAEYVICLILLLSLLLLRASKNDFAPRTYRFIFYAIVFTVLSELSFTLYVDNYGFSNLVGHYLKLFSFFMVYRAIIITGIEEPHNLIFRELEKANQKLSEEIAVRKETECKRDKLIAELKGALDEIRSLRGILPICSNCKKIRDDKGYWNQLEKYISDHSEAVFSHGICPECAEKLYPDIETEDE